MVLLNQTSTVFKSPPSDTRNNRNFEVPTLLSDFWFL